MKGFTAHRMVGQEDKQLLKEIETLAEIIEWLEHKEHCDLDRASESITVDEKEIKEWLKSPSLDRVRSWLKK